MAATRGAAAALLAEVGPSRGTPCLRLPAGSWETSPSEAFSSDFSDSGAPLFHLAGSPQLLAADSPAGSCPGHPPRLNVPKHHNLLR